MKTKILKNTQSITVILVILISLFMAIAETGPNESQNISLLGNISLGIENNSQNNLTNTNHTSTNQSGLLNFTIPSNTSISNNTFSKIINETLNESQNELSEPLNETLEESKPLKNEKDSNITQNFSNTPPLLEDFQNNSKNTSHTDQQKIENQSDNQTQDLFINSLEENIETTAAISATSTNGLIAYEQQNDNQPQYRTWNGTNFTTVSTTLALGGGDLQWHVLRASHEHDEYILGVIDKQEDINIQIYDATAQSWGNLLEVTTTMPVSTYRSLDIAYEQVSGDALIVYENSSTTDNVIAYRTWNGSNYSVESSFTPSFTDTTTLARWIELVPKKGSNQIMLVVHNDVGDIYAVPWNGTNFDTSQEIEASTATTSSTEQHFRFAWEEQSGEGMLWYGETDLTYRTYDPSSGFSGTETTITTGAIDALRLCSDPTSDYIGVIWQDSGNDVNARMWNGSEILASPPSQDASTEANGGNNANVDCAWFNSSTALFGFIDGNALNMDYFTFTKSNTWSTADLTSTLTTSTFAADDIKGVRFTEHPTTSFIMVITQDILEDISAILWNGTGFETIGESPLETLTEVTNGAQESAMFDWERYDPVPNVTNTLPSSAPLSPGDIVDINATIIDNINISHVFLNITYPNGSSIRVEMSDPQGDDSYNYTFTDTNSIGSYSARIDANDTSIFENRNTTEIATFSITESVLPSVKGVLPELNSEFNSSQSIEIAANVTDNQEVDTVFANITQPNGTVVQVTLTNSLNEKFNNSITIPELLGIYTIIIIANDTSGNINNSQTTNFTVYDGTNPTVEDLIPSVDTSIGIGQTLEVSANVSDNINISTVFASITMPNGTTEQLNLIQTIDTKYNSSYSPPDLAGTYTIIINANDTSENINNSQTTNFSVTDSLAPNVTGLLPLVDTSISVSSSIEISANVSDDAGVSAVVANITFPNGTLEQVVLQQALGEKYNSTFVPPPLIGTYNITVIANDTSNNINSSQTSNFTIIDITPPSLNALLPATETIFMTQTSIEIAANVSDDIEVSSASANITQPNGTIVQLTLTNVVGDKYNTSFTTPNSTGNYTILFIANDTTGNFNNTQTTNFTVSNVDITSPTIELTNPTPANGTAQNSTTLTINITALDLNLANITINLYNNSGFLLSQNHSSTSPFTITYQDLSEGTYSINATAKDESNNTNSTETITITLDTTSPTFDTIPPNSSTQFLENISVLFSATDENSIGEFSINDTSGFAITTNNSNGTLTNITLLTPGNYSLLVTVNDSAGNKVSLTYLVTITKRDSVVYTYLNGSRANISILEGENITLNGTLIDGEGNITLYNDGTQINQGNSSVQNTTVFNSAGTFNITVTYEETGNYSHGFETFFVTVSSSSSDSGDDSSSSTGSSGSSGGGGGGGSSCPPGQVVQGGKCTTPSTSAEPSQSEQENDQSTDSQGTTSAGALFDVIQNLPEPDVSDGELSIFVDLLNFGDLETVDVEVVYTILQNGQVVLKEFETVTVEGELTYEKKFDVSQLGDGEYSVKTQIFYGNSQTAFSEHGFTLKSAKSAQKENIAGKAIAKLSSFAQNSWKHESARNVILIWFVGFLFVILTLWFILWKRRREKEKEENKRSDKKKEPKHTKKAYSKHPSKTKKKRGHLVIIRHKK